MGDDDRRPLGHDQVERGLNLRLGERVYAGCGLIENEDAGVLHQHARQGHQLPLAHRQAAAPFAHLAGDAVRQRLQPLPTTDLPCRGLDALVAGLRPGVADVVGHRAGEEERHLGDDAQLAAVSGQVEGADVLPIDMDRAFLELVVAGDELDDARLARPRVADEGDALAGPDVEAEVVEHLLL